MIQTLFRTLIFLVIASSAFAFQRARETRYRVCGENQIPNCLMKPNEKALPFVMIHTSDSSAGLRPVALLIHGLSDSAHSMEDLGTFLFEKGFNVTSILLSGHGTKPEDLHKIRLEDWQDDVRFGIELAHRYGQNLVIGGYSTGGALAVDYAAKNPSEVKALVLMAPALSISHWAFAACNLAKVEPWAWQDGDGAEDEFPTKYKKGSSNAVCELYRQTWKFPRNLDLQMPIFTLMTSADQTINFARSYEMVRKFSNPLNETLIYRPAGFETGKIEISADSEVQKDSQRTKSVEVYDSIAHAALPFSPRKGLPHYNPRFDQFEAQLTHFLTVTNFISP